MILPQSKNIGRKIYFKYTAFALLSLSSIASIVSMIIPEFREVLKSHLLHPFIQNPVYFSIQIGIDLILAYIIAGKAGEYILDKHKPTSQTIFTSIFAMWFGVLVVAFCSEVVQRGIEYGFGFELFGLGALLWLFTGGPVFLLIAAIHGATTVNLIAKEMNNFKNSTVHEPTKSQFK